MMQNKMNSPIKRLVIFTVFVLFFISCSNTNQTETANADEYFTCSMDPQVIENKPGNCPICHMKLIKVNKNNLKDGQIKLSEQQIKLANITFDTIRIQEFAKEIILTGKVTIDQNLLSAISAKIQGRVERLAIKTPGDYIKKGQLLYEIYSEDLNSAQAEYLLSLEKSNISGGFSEASRNKLLLYGMNMSQIDLLKKTKQIINKVPIYSDIEGFVSEISLNEGDYVTSGNTLFQIATINSLWVEAQLYLPYLPYIQLGTEANFSIPSANENTLWGKVIFIDPQVHAPERFVLARFQINNQSQKIKPGMLASITLQTEKKRTLAIPAAAIIQDSKGPNLWVRNRDNVFENKMVTIGLQNSRMIEITNGLKQGDIVVITGSYLLNSEYIFKKGTNPMKGHSDMPGMKM